MTDYLHPDDVADATRKSMMMMTDITVVMIEHLTGYRRQLVEVVGVSDEDASFMTAAYHSTLLSIVFADNQNPEGTAP